MRGSPVLPVEQAGKIGPVRGFPAAPTVLGLALQAAFAAGPCSFASSS